MGRLGIEGVHETDWIDDLTVTPMSTQKRFFMGHDGDRGRPNFMWATMEQGQTSPRHAHRGWSCTVILDGSFVIGGVEFTAGQMLIVEPDVVYGPFEPGPDGVTLVEYFEHEDAIPPVWDESDPRVQELYAASEGGDPYARYR